MWDIRDGMCKQTFSGHESDINAITVSFSILCEFYIVFDPLVHFVAFSVDHFRLIPVCDMVESDG